VLALAMHRRLPQVADAGAFVTAYRKSHVASKAVIDLPPSPDGG